MIYVLNKIKNFFYIQGEIIAISVKRFFKNDQMQHATSLTYYTLFAIVPILALLFGIAKGFNLDDKLKIFIVERFSEQQDIVDWMYKFADTTLKNADGGIIAGIGILILFWTVIRLATYIEKSFNQTWQVQKGRNFFRKISDFLSLLFIAPILFVILSSSSLLIKNMVMRLPELISCSLQTMSLIAIGLELLPVVLTWLLFTLIYIFVPHTKVRVLPAFFAGFFAALLYQAAQTFYIAVQVKLSSYNSIYGSFSALPLFLIWLQWSWLITLFGNQIAFVAQNYKTGQFDKNLSKISDELSFKYLLMVCKVVVNQFELLAPPVTQGDITKITQLSSIQVQEALYTLIDAEVICRVDNEESDDYTYVPAIPTDKLTIIEVVKRISQNGFNESDIDNNQLFDKMSKLVDELNLEIVKSNNNKLIRDI